MNSKLTNLLRTFYYDGELLQLPDFVRDQQYTRDLVYFENRSVFAPGVVQGLSLGGIGKSVLTVSTGTAFTADGVPLFVVNDTDASFDFTYAALPPGTYYVPLKYSDDNTPGNNSVLRTTHTITEKPVVDTPSAALPVSPMVILGTVTINASSIITSTDMSPASKRQLSSVLLPAAAALPPTGPVTTDAAAHKHSAPEPGDGAKEGSSARSFRGPLTVGPFTQSHHAALYVLQDHGEQHAGASVARFDFRDDDGLHSGVTVGLQKSDGTHALLSAQHAGNEVWELGSDGTPRTLSDAALKVDVRPLAGALERTAALRPVSFAWRDDPTGRRRLGLLANEVAAVVPEIVGTNAQGRATLSYQELLPLLLQAIRELADRVVELEQRGAEDGERR